MIQVAEDDLSKIADPQSRAAAEAFVKPLKAKFGDTDPGMAARAWDSIMMLAKAVEAGEDDRRHCDARCIREAWPL